MDRKKSGERPSFFAGVRNIVTQGIERRRVERTALLMDVAVFLASFFFSRRHIAFGAYPLAAALVATLPSRVWLSLVGALLGAFSLGSEGIIHAIIAVVIVFLRIIISGGAKNNEAVLFREAYVMRVAAAAIGSFIGAVYEILLGSFSLSSVLFGCFGVLLTVVACFLYFGLLTSSITPTELVSGNGQALFGHREGKALVELYLFQASALAFAFLLTISLDGYDFFGISLAYIFAGVLTLFVAARFGATRAMAVGFVSAVGVGATEAVGFALCGLCAGLLFNLGLAYALLGGAVALGGWCAYSGGLSSFLGTIPEYGVCALIMTPYLRRAVREPTQNGERRADATAIRSIVASAGAKHRARVAFDSKTEEELLFAAHSIKEYAKGKGHTRFDDYRNIVIGAISCVTPTPCDEKIDIIATKLYKNGSVSAEELTRILEGATGASALLAELSRLCEKYEGECSTGERLCPVYSGYELVSRMLSARRTAKEEETIPAKGASDAATAAFCKKGFVDGVVRVYGERRMHVIAAGEDESGALISSPEVLAAISDSIGAPLAKPEFFRRDSIVILETDSLPVLSYEFATVGTAAESTGVSGDSSASFERDGYVCALLSDGMGSGEVAKRTSSLVVDYLGALYSPLVSAATPLAAINRIIRDRGEECTATVDLFSLDLYTGEASFVKCGAPPSYVKHSDSITRYRSATPPIGLLGEVDSETVRLRVAVGDYIVMTSDGACPIPDEVPWLIEFLSRPSDLSADEYARALLKRARELSPSPDDVTVSVLKILDGREVADGSDNRKK